MNTIEIQRKLENICEIAHEPKHAFQTLNYISNYIHLIFIDPMSISDDDSSDQRNYPLWREIVKRSTESIRENVHRRE